MINLQKNTRHRVFSFLTYTRNNVNARVMGTAGDTEHTVPNHYVYAKIREILIYDITGINYQDRHRSH